MSLSVQLPPPHFQSPHRRRPRPSRTATQDGEEDREEWEEEREEEEDEGGVREGEGVELAVEVAAALEAGEVARGAER